MIPRKDGEMNAELSIDRLFHSDLVWPRPKLRLCAKGHLAVSECRTGEDGAGPGQNGEGDDNGTRAIRVGDMREPGQTEFYCSQESFRRSNIERLVVPFRSRRGSNIRGEGDTV